QIFTKCTEADGGIFANNPEIISVANLFKHNPHLKLSDLIVVSLGTGIKAEEETAKKRLHSIGVLNWLVDQNIIDIMLSASTDVSEWTLDAFGIENYRVQVILDTSLMHMDN